MQLRVRRLNPRAQLPVRSTPDALGLDLHACLEAPLTLPVGQDVVVSTGIALATPPGWGALITGRSGRRFRHGVDPFVGTLDGDYRDEVKILLVALRGVVVIHHGDRIAQLVLIPNPLVDVVETVDLDGTGHAGFGSTGA